MSQQERELQSFADDNGFDLENENDRPCSPTQQDGLAKALVMVLCAGPVEDVKAAHVEAYKALDAAGWTLQPE